MPRAKQARKSNARREPEIPPLAFWFMREILPLLRHRRRSASRSVRHLRNAGIEVLEAMRAFLDETIEWLREEERSSPMKRIRVED
jgi:hypothetical protein